MKKILKIIAIPFILLLALIVFSPIYFKHLIIFYYFRWFGKYKPNPNKFNQWFGYLIWDDRIEKEKKNNPWRLDK